MSERQRQWLVESVGWAYDAFEWDDVRDRPAFVRWQFRELTVEIATMKVGDVALPGSRLVVLMPGAGYLKGDAVSVPHTDGSAGWNWSPNAGGQWWVDFNAATVDPACRDKAEKLVIDLLALLRARKVQTHGGL